MSALGERAATVIGMSVNEELQMNSFMESGYGVAAFWIIIYLVAVISVVRKKERRTKAVRYLRDWYTVILSVAAAAAFFGFAMSGPHGAFGGALGSILSSIWLCLFSASVTASQ